MAEPVRVFTTTLQQFNSDLWSFHLPVPIDIARQFVDGDDRRVVCTLNGTHTFQCALMPAGQENWFINVNKAIRKKLGLRLGMEVETRLEKDRSEYGLPVPEELRTLLEMDGEFSEYFHQLSPGKQRTLLHLVGKYKQTDTRLQKALVIADYLKWAKGKLDFKQLREAFRQANN